MAVDWEAIKFGRKTVGLRQKFGGQVDQAVSIVMEPGGAEIAAGMERWAALVGDFGEAWPAVTKLIHRHNARTFASEGAATGDRRRWAELTPRYSAIKAREFPGRPLLVRTAALRSALTGVGPGSQVVSSRTSLEVSARGESRQIGEYHQRGTSRMVARPPVKFARSLRNKRGLMFVVSQMLQRIIVDHRKAALGVNADVMDAASVERRLGSLDTLSRRRTE